ncbi:MAG: sodium:proton antiporter NhaD [Gammaproteobacteria bacterium]|jgi:Na+/H+ antiporter NhaD/arsenite permease-like protein
MNQLSRYLLAMLSLLIPGAALAATTDAVHQVNLTTDVFGITALAIFVIAYGLVISEEFSDLRKSKPMIVAAGMIWILVAIGYALHGDRHSAGLAVEHNIMEFAELMLFLLAAMTYINTMDERQVFKALRAWLVTRGFSLRQIFWITGALAFFISPFADNLTTALLMGAVVLAVASGNRRFIVVALINIVVAANAGGAYSPFGDITTLMVWQKQKASFFQFFDLFIPAAVNWLVPAFLMSLSIGKAKPEGTQEAISIRPGGYVVIALFVLTIALAVAGHNYLNLPPVLGMMTGLGLLKLYGFFIRRADLAYFRRHPVPEPDVLAPEYREHFKSRHRPFDIFISMKRAEWDTLMFFYGVVLCVGGLGTIGYLALASHSLYGGLGDTSANVLVGVLSSIVDNIPVMYAVLTMNPPMDMHQWLLATLTAGVGGSMLSIGSAAGVGLMGQARGTYTFFSHLRWSWAIILGYAASIWVHMLVNGP